MGKKDKDPTPNHAHIPNKDIIQRLNFLYQASVYLTNLSHVVPPSSLGIVKGEQEGEQEDNQVRNRGQNQDQDPNLNLNPKLKSKSKSKQARRTSRLRTRTADELARAYVNTMTMVGKKTVVHMDPSIKRTLCKACRGVLVPGVSVQVRVRRSSSHRHAVVLRCARCGYGRRLPAPARKGWDGRGRWCESEEEEEDRPAPNASSSNQEEEKKGEEENGDVDERETAKAVKKKKKKKKKKGQSRHVYPPLPLSARRDAGHVVFRGTERVDVRMDEVDEVGDGVFAV